MIIDSMVEAVSSATIPAQGHLPGLTIAKNAVSKMLIEMRVVGAADQHSVAEALAAHPCHQRFTR